MTMITDREKIRLISGRSFWTFGIDGHEDLPVLKMSDGPAGLRIQYKDEGYESPSGSRPAVCYPSAAACACSFDPELMRKTGRALGLDCREYGAAVLLAPALNIKRNPLCGRNFEYFSEDPYLSGVMAAAYVKGVQSTGTGACVKHFAANSQETRRAKSNSVVDMQTLFDIYLKAFEIVIEEAEPAMVMLAYNMLNGVYCCENEWLIGDVLRNQFGFDGVCVSDWSAVNRICTSFNAGLDLRMPGGVEGDEEYLCLSLASGKLEKEAVDRAAGKIVDFIKKYQKACEKEYAYDREKNIKTAAKMAASSIVLLKNEGAMPLSKDKKVLVVGEMAKFPKYRGGGSGGVKLSHAVTPWTALRKRFPDISYSKGYDISGETASDEMLIKEAVKAASEADSVIVFAGLPEFFETEGLDRPDLNLPKPQDELISRIAEVNPEITVVVSAGSAVLMPWERSVNSIFMCYPLGSCTGDAMADVITGRVNPQGKLCETFPLKMCDLPSAGFFPSREQDASYSEGKYIGYRYFEDREREVLFPFGHGLSYTEFTYGKLSAELKDNSIDLSVSVTNTGKRRGSEAVQFYISHESEGKYKELIAFDKVHLRSGETKEVRVSVPLKRLAVTGKEDMSRIVRSGKYTVFAAASVRDIRSCSDIFIKEETRVPLKVRVPEPVNVKDGRRYSRNTSLSELGQSRLLRLIPKMIKSYLLEKQSRFMSGADMYAVVENSPLRQLPMGTNGKVSAYRVKQITDLLEKLLHRKI